jgi:ferric-dicitrate binding protein FerR (iron transport regulator)
MNSKIETQPKVSSLKRPWHGRSLSPKERRRLYTAIGCIVFATCLSLFYTMGAWNAVSAFVAAQRVVEQEPRYLKATVTVTAGAGNFTILAKDRTVREFEDGTRVELPAGAELEVDYTSHQRLLRLRAGDVIVHVAKDPSRPLTVQANDVRATALGTIFKVSISPTVQVHVYEGVVVVADGPPGSGAWGTQLKAGESFPRKAK